MRVTRLALAGLATIAAPGASAQTGSSNWLVAAECSNLRASEQRRCVNDRLARKEQAVARAYAEALAAARAGFARWGAKDQRLNPRRFVRAHLDWQRFVTSNCTALGAFGGGSNLSVADRIAACRERELDQRIAIYREMADGSYGQ